MNTPNPSGELVANLLRAAERNGFMYDDLDAVEKAADRITTLERRVGELEGLLSKAAHHVPPLLNGIELRQRIRAALQD